MATKKQNRHRVVRKVRRALNSTHEGPASSTGRRLYHHCYGAGISKGCLEGYGDHSYWDGIDEEIALLGDTDNPEYWENRKNEEERIIYYDDAA
jgi:hypothetical protein